MAKETISKSGVKRVYSNAADIITVEGSKDKIYTKGGKDRITLSKGNSNLVDAGTGNDIITVNAGNKHTLQGGTGSDKYIFNAEISKSSRYTIDRAITRKKIRTPCSLRKSAKEM